MKISVVIPAHNEEKLVGNVIKETVKVLDRKHDYEIIAIDDNSDDRTGKILDKLAKNKRVKVVHKVNERKGPSGLGGALKEGFSVFNGDIVIPMMGDMSDDPADMLKMIEKIKDGYDVVCGSRFVDGGLVENYPVSKMIAHRIYNRLFSLIFGLKLKDFSNAFKAYRRIVIKKTKPESNGFEITAEILLKAHILGYKIAEVPVKWYGRIAGYSKFGTFKKLPVIGWQYGRIAVRLYFKFLLSKLIGK